MNNIKDYEQAMWNAAQQGDKNAFAKLMSPNAVMVCGGYRCSGAEYTELISDFGFSSVEINCFEVVSETESTVQVHYIVKTTANSAETADLAGVFHVTSTWSKQSGEWKLVFNMDSRIQGDEK